MIISLIFWSPHPPLIDTNNTILQYHSGWQMILGHKRYRLMMYSCIAKLPCLLLKLIFLQWLQHDRVCGAANAVQGGVQPVVHEVPPPSQSASADQPAVRGARGEAQEDRAEQQPVQGTHRHTHLTTISEKPQWVAVQIVGLHIYVGRANPRSLVTSQPNECPVASLRGSVITSWSAAYPSAP